MPQDIAAELKSFSMKKSGPFFKFYSRLYERNLLPLFLDARMDQIRIYYARQASQVLLESVDAKEAFAFQDAVLRRERSRQIAYRSQRDHTCHTLNNFILGWYIYYNSPTLKSAFRDAFERRKLKRYGPERVFGSIWIYVSLLHDIGYIFEGDFSKPGTFQKNQAIKHAIKCLNNYFNNRFWKHNRLSSTDRRKIVEQGVISPLDFSAKNIDEMSTLLQNIECNNQVWKEVGQHYDIKFSKSKLSAMSNIFDIWAENYRQFKNPKMSKMIHRLEKDFEDSRVNGIGGKGPKILNHGVCSGLILMQFITYYYTLHLGMSALGGDGKLADIKERYDRREKRYTIDLWWSGHVWATASTAIHDRYHELIPTSRSRVSKLSLSDDPLTFLGILVDELQMWDRFNVFDPLTDHLFPDIPTQSSDVTLETDKAVKRIAFSAPIHEIKKLEIALDQRLEDWSDVVSLAVKT